MEEKFRISLLGTLSNHFNKEQLEIIDNVLTVQISNYDITQKSTEIQIYNQGIPQEIKTFLVSKKLKGLTSTSLKHYERTLKHFSLNIDKDIKLLSANDIRLYLLSYCQTHNVGNSTLDDKRRVLNSLFSWMIREDLISVNPMLKIDAIKCDKTIKEPLTSIELEKMRNATNTSREKAILELLYSTGMRVTELTLLNKTDIDFQNGRVKVFGKGKKERWCFINAKAELSVKKYIFTRTDNEEALFVASKKPYNRLGKGTIEKTIKEISKRATINKQVTPHTFRRTMASHALANGAQLSEIQLMLGHQNSSTTLIYAKMDIQNLQQVHRRCVI